MFTNSITGAQSSDWIYKSKRQSFAPYYNDIIEHPVGQLRLSLRIENNNSCVFSITSLNYTAIILFFQKLFTLNVPKFTTATRIIVMMCSAITPECLYDNSTINLIGNVFCPNTKCSGKNCLQKNFQSLGRSNYQCLRGASVYQARIILFEDQTFFFCRLVKGFTLLKGV